MPATVLPVGKIILALPFVLLSVFSYLPNWFVLIVNAAKFFFVSPGKNLFIKDLRLLKFSLKYEDNIRNEIKQNNEDYIIYHN